MVKLCSLVEMGTMSECARWEAVVYGVLLIAGGIMGWSRKRSTISLVAGGMSGLIVLSAAFFYSRLGLFVLASMALGLMAVFFNRYISSKKFMPAGFMTLASAGSFLLYLATLVIV